jgi:hypothetical protein
MSVNLQFFMFLMTIIWIHLLRLFSWLGRYAKIVDHLAVKNVAQGAPLGGGSNLHDCLGTHLHRIAVRPDPYCMLCSLHDPMDRNHL